MIWIVALLNNNRQRLKHSGKQYEKSLPIKTISNFTYYEK